VRVDKALDVSGFRNYVEAIRSCGDHPMPTLTDEVLESVVAVVQAYVEVRETYEDTCGFVIVRLRDGQYGVFHEWSDSSGHG
jgi:hypothetical protein